MPRQPFEELIQTDASIEEDILFHRRDLIVQRIGWILGGLILLAALLGFLGNGPLSSASISDPTGAIEVAYSRFPHWQSKITLDVTVRPTPINNGNLRIWFDRSYFDSVRPEYILPQPHSSILSGERIIYEFPAGDAAHGKITFHFTATRFGPLRCIVGLTDQQSVSFRQFIYP